MGISRLVWYLVQYTIYVLHYVPQPIKCLFMTKSAVGKWIFVLTYVVTLPVPPKVCCYPTNNVQG